MREVHRLQDEWEGVRVGIEVTIDWDKVGCENPKDERCKQLIRTLLRELFDTIAEAMADNSGE
ncbi:hypothetical protein IPA_03070 [Ignicoccus pacificus DSM 13166]|uniref:Uncharacterized protein n=1 Tax=Ignicoccus pacificus DSM 13166 TaxID=940294 RepID=A0A977KAY9_9CREN|nr:hypothetical protein IPA_03070 [Ignicoccus pacificus DSM 13166]